MNMYVQLLDILLRKPNKILLYKNFHIVHILAFHLLLAAHAKLHSSSQLTNGIKMAAWGEKYIKKEGVFT